MTVTIVVGGFYGDEGKGKVVSALAENMQPEIIARGGVGPNAGHTVVYNGQTFKLRMLPSGFHLKKAKLLIGSGVLIDPDVLLKELEMTKAHQRVGVDPQCGIILPKHKTTDTSDPHLVKKVGTSGTGTGPANADRAMRILPLARDEPRLQQYLTPVAKTIHEAIDNGKSILVEGSQATYLSLFHGGYPYVTSKDTCASAICSDVGIGPKAVDEVVIVFKAYVTRVGEGPLENELTHEEAEKRGWAEYGTVTGRPRRAAPFNFELAKHAVKLNSATQIALTKIDIVFPQDAHKTSYEDLSKQAKEFIEKIESETKTPVTIIGTGPSTKDTIIR